MNSIWKCAINKKKKTFIFFEIDKGNHMITGDIVAIIGYDCNRLMCVCIYWNVFLNGKKEIVL